MATGLQLLASEKEHGSSEEGVVGGLRALFVLLDLSGTATLKGSTGYEQIRSG